MQQKDLILQTTKSKDHYQLKKQKSHVSMDNKMGGKIMKELAWLRLKNALL